MISKILAASAAVTLAAAPALAVPNPAASLSISKSVRAGSSTGKKDRLAGQGVIIAVVAAAAVIAGIVIVADNNDDDNSDSN